MTPEQFIERWEGSGAAERANYQLFLTELCALLDVPQPEPSRADDAENAYVFERNVHFQEADGDTSIGRIDLYRRGSFVLEAKQGSDAPEAAEQATKLLSASSKISKRRGTAVRGTRGWDDAMVRARGQADRYARALPTAEGWPPFLVVVDVGHSIELYSEFSRSGKTYVQFPDPQSFRIRLTDLTKPEVRERLRAVWLDPASLDPSRRAAKVTRELAQRLAELAKLLEKAGHEPEEVARFLMRSLFTMFAEDVELIPKGSFKDLLAGLLSEPENFQPAAEELWRTMNQGGYSPGLRRRLLRFNGGLFADSRALPLTGPMLQLLHEAAGANWTDVEPAIFGTLLERALSPLERHKLGAHYTPRAYVERLVLPTIIEPLREDWQAAYAAAVTAAKQGDLPAAQKIVHDYHDQLCKTNVLDPACGSGNFLYVTLEQMKRLEGEVLNALREFGDTQQTIYEVDPHQFLGIEINPRAAAITDLVLWIGYLQWHFRTRGHTALTEPIIKRYTNIECRDAVLAWDRKEPVLDEQGKPVTRWDGRTMKPHPVTGEEVPDETARVLVERYVNPRKAEWPAADYVVGNPPYIGVRLIKSALGAEYVECLRATYNEVPETSDLVMYWWHKGALGIEHENVKRFGFITTNSIVQEYSRRIVDKHISGASPNVSIIVAVADHPWVESADGAAVRVAMTVATRTAVNLRPRLLRIVGENGENVHVVDQYVNRISSLLEPWSHAVSRTQLSANRKMCYQGVVPAGDGFKLTSDELHAFNVQSTTLSRVVRKYIIGRDLVQVPESRFIVDFFGLEELEAKRLHPELYQRLLDRVYPERRQNRRETYRSKWWIFAEPRPALRTALDGLNRFIVTPYTAKHRPFVFVDGNVLPDAMAYAIATDDAHLLGILSSRGHHVWAKAEGGTLEDRPRYNSNVTFVPFPFPVCTEEQKARIRELGEQLDAHRKRQQALHPKLTLTDMYNVLEKLRAGERKTFDGSITSATSAPHPDLSRKGRGDRGEVMPPSLLTAKERTIHEQGLVSVLKQIHEELDAAVFDAYGWPTNLSDEEILERLVALNAERAAEEARGIVRWLRPEFQNPSADGKLQKGLTLVEEEGEDEEEPLTPALSHKGRGSTRSGKDTATRDTGTKSTGKASGTRGKEPHTPTLSREGRGSKLKATARDWPKGREAQAKAVLAALRDSAGSVTAEELAAMFGRSKSTGRASGTRSETIAELLEALATLGQARRLRGGKYTN